MKKELAALTLAGLINTAAAEPTLSAAPERPSSPEQPTQQHEDPALLSTRRRTFDLAPHLTGTRERRRAAEAGAVIEMDIP